MRIDAHHHFWRYDPDEYPWIGNGMERLRQDFLLTGLIAELDRAEIDGAISVQARQSLAETDMLLEIAAGSERILGVVGWLPLHQPAIGELLERYAKTPKLAGLRHVLQDEPDDRYILRDDFNRGVDLLAPLGLVYDILIYERHLPQAIEFVDRHPDQRFVLDHIAKPRIAANELSPWRERLFDLARRPNVFCKLSGLVTEADHRTWTPADLRPFYDVALDAFGPQRLMFGSDWPVCLLASEYQQWFHIVSDWISELSASEQARILGGTAGDAYFKGLV